MVYTTHLVNKDFSNCLPPMFGAEIERNQPLPDVLFSVNNTLMVENVAGRKNRGSRGFFSATLAKKVAGI